MATERLTMRRIRQVLHLHFGVRASARVIAREVGVGRSTVQDYLTRATTAGLGWPLPADLTDEALELLLFPAPSCKPGARRHPEPDWAALVREMKRPGVSLLILWEEYNAVHPQGYAYSRFCQLFREFERRLSPTMRQTHVAGHKAFVDYSGKKVPITGNCSPCSGGFLRHRRGEQYEPERVEHRGLIELRRADHGAEGSVCFGAPFGTETIGDLAEDDARSDLSLADIVGVRDIPAGHEYEQMCPVGGDAFAQLAAWLADGDSRHDPIEPALQIGEILHQSGIFQCLSSSPDCHCTQQQPLESDAEGDIAALDGILRIAEKMR
jgi:hypothetical protein